MVQFQKVIRPFLDVKDHLLNPFTHPLCGAKVTHITGDKLSVKDEWMRALAVSTLASVLIFGVLSLAGHAVIPIVGAALTIPVIFYSYMGIAKVFKLRYARIQAPLFTALKQGNIDDFRETLKKNKHLSLVYRDHQGHTAFHYLTSLPNQRTAPQLLESLLFDREIMLKLGGELKVRTDSLGNLDLAHIYSTKKYGKEDCALLLIGALGDRELWNLYSLHLYTKYPEDASDIIAKVKDVLEL